MRTAKNSPHRPQVGPIPRLPHPPACCGRFGGGLLGMVDGAERLDVPVGVGATLAAGDDVVDVGGGLPACAAGRFVAEVAPAQAVPAGWEWDPVGVVPGFGLVVFAVTGAGSGEVGAGGVGAGSGGSGSHWSGWGSVLVWVPSSSSATRMRVRPMSARVSPSVRRGVVSMVTGMVMGGVVAIVWLRRLVAGPGVEPGMLR